MNEEERIHLNKKYYFLPSNTVDKKSLLIVMSTHNQKDRYFFFKKIKELNYRSADVIFVTDPNNSYYLEKDMGETYLNFFEFILNGYENSSVSFFGSSMSGFAALFYSIRLGCSAIVNNPQVDLRESLDHAWPDLKHTLSNVCSLDLNIISHEQILGSCFVVSGKHPMDSMNRKKLDVSSSLFNTYISKTVNDVSHGFYFNNCEDIFIIHQLIQRFNEMKLTKIDKVKY